jgi:mannan endo-1,4-beta-mannosidase
VIGKQVRARIVALTALSILVVGATVLAGSATAGPASASTPLALGVAVFQPTNAFQSYQSAVGSVPSFLEWYQSWPDSAPGIGADSPLFLASQEQLVEADHLVPMISWGTENLPLTSIVNGSEDAIALAPAVALAKSYPGTLFIRLDWEMNGSWSGWNPDNAAQAGLGESPSTYVAMWQHVVNYFRNAGVTNVKWVWAPNVDAGTGTMAAYYPGDSYVDDVGLDGYNNAYTQDGSWLTPEQVFGASYTELEGVTSKPVIITETSSVEANSSEAAVDESKAQWMDELSAYVPTLGNVVGVCWFNQVATVDGYGSVDYSIDTSAASLSSWDQDFADNPLYQGVLPGATQAPDPSEPTTTTTTSGGASQPVQTSNVAGKRPDVLPADAPEAPVALLLPVAGMGLFGLTLYRRRRRSESEAPRTDMGGSESRR